MTLRDHRPKLPTPRSPVPRSSVPEFSAARPHCPRVPGPSAPWSPALRPLGPQAPPRSPWRRPRTYAGRARSTVALGSRKAPVRGGGRETETKVPTTDRGTWPASPTHPWPEHPAAQGRRHLGPSAARRRSTALRGETRRGGLRAKVNPREAATRTRPKWNLRGRAGRLTGAGPRRGGACKAGEEPLCRGRVASGRSLGRGGPLMGGVWGGAGPSVGAGAQWAESRLVQGAGSSRRPAAERRLSVQLSLCSGRGVCGGSGPERRCCRGEVSPPRRSSQRQRQGLRVSVVSAGPAAPRPGPWGSAASASRPHLLEIRLLSSASKYVFKKERKQTNLAFIHKEEIHFG